MEISPWAAIEVAQWWPSKVPSGGHTISWVALGSDTGSDVQGGTLLGFEVNGIHNLVHITSGLLLLAGAGRPATARAVCLLFGMSYAVVTVIGLIDGETVLGLLPVNGADNVLHIALTVLALVAALLPSCRRARA